MQLNVNGELFETDYDPDTPLLWVLRDDLKLKGAKFGCGIGVCGACTVHIDGFAMRSCVTSLGDVEGAKIVTVEGLSEDGSHPVQRAWIENDVPQCGYCQTGFIMEVAAMAAEDPKPSAQEIEARISNICRCGTYDRIRTAIQEVAEA